MGISTPKIFVILYNTQLIYLKFMNIFFMLYLTFICQFVKWDENT